MSMRKRLFASFATAAFALALTSSAALAAKGDCGQPSSNGSGPVATDCLFILQASVGAQTCSPVCICDLNASTGNPNATDALSCLKAATGTPGLLNCPCSSGPPPKNACSVGEFIAAAGSDLDAGWNGAGHNANITEGASIFIEVVRRCGGDGAVCHLDSECTGETCDLTCDCDSTTDTVCEVSGPIGDQRCLVVYAEGVCNERGLRRAPTAASASSSSARHCHCLRKARRPASRRTSKRTSPEPPTLPPAKAKQGPSCARACTSGSALRSRARCAACWRRIR